MRNLSRIALCLVLPCSGGCLAVVAAAGGAAYFAYEYLEGGWVAHKYEADFDRTMTATVAVIDEFKLGHAQIPRTPPKAEFKVLSDEDEIAVEVNSVTETVTEVRFRVGKNGDADEDEDEALSKRMLRKIEGRLKR